MKLEYNIPVELDTYAKITHTFKEIEFDIFIGESIDTDQRWQDAFAVFRTHLGKYRHPFKVSPECVNDLDEKTFCDSMCDMVIDAFKSKYGELKPFSPHI